MFAAQAGFKFASFDWLRLTELTLDWDWLANPLTRQPITFLIT